ncbi:hypothetical protein A6A40_21180 (plasmid) [Azospirillum humicireducens]|uniref:Iron transporter n=2 Tax=Azospirillum TaxID=191 RepID=A0A2R4VSW3_9PROT|nr:MULTISPECIES: hypothetical protein [Azospirillum]AWB07533.1 hypothetical protein A6A40_21180 [Azospirillum humicireducens]CBS88673.1 conserved membrane protein of unknown function [Azospirillum lipoferum 4B]
MKRKAEIALRTVTAVVGGYALAAGTAAALALALPAVQDRSEAVLTATMAGLLPCVLTVVMVFAAASALRALAWTAGLTAAAWAAVSLLTSMTGIGS